nr:hypothetical protein [uncultured Brevundimonas sp.]
MKVTSIFGLALGALTISLCGVSEAVACLVPPPAPPEVVAARTAQWQSELWGRAQSVFIARTASPGRVRNGGNRAILVPVLQLKGPEVKSGVRIAHTHWNSCGPAPWLDALNGRSDEFFVAYSSLAEPDGSSITATLRLNNLVDPTVIEAWSKAYEGR